MQMLTFSRPYGVYVTRDVAGFADDMAETLLKLGVARRATHAEVTEGRKPTPPGEGEVAPPPTGERMAVLFDVSTAQYRRGELAWFPESIVLDYERRAIAHRPTKDELRIALAPKADRPALVALRFLAHVPPYQMGEVAWFSPEVAQQYAEKRVDGAPIVEPAGPAHPESGDAADAGQQGAKAPDSAPDKMVRRAPVQK